MSTLTYALPTHSRARLAERLPESTRDQWLGWLEDYEWELSTLASLLRLALTLGVLGAVWRWYTVDVGWEGDVGTVMVTGLVAVTLLAVFGIAIPHALAVHAGEAILARSLGLLAVLRVVFWPCGRFFEAVEFVVRRLLGKAEMTEAAETERVEQEILDAVSEGEATGAVDEDKKEMIESVFELDETPVSAIMTPRTDIHAVSADASFADVRDVTLRSGHSRIPVYEGSIDHIVGVVYAKDLLRVNAGEPFDMRKIMRTAPYVPETKTLDELLNEFRATKVQIAIVLDEYGGTAGLATLEDILEELVGEIADEYDQQPPPAMNRVDDDTLEVDARVHVSEINAELGLELPEEQDYETIGGYVFATLGKIPAVGEEFQQANLRVRILDAEPRRIKRLQLHVLREKAEAV
jgi:CBS domain containing-hemolysin-like protein